MGKTSLEVRKRYKQKNMRYVSLELHRRTDADILEKLEEVPSKQGYIKTCIRKDIRAGRE